MGIESYVVGGFVRDHLLGINNIKDIDITINIKLPATTAIICSCGEQTKLTTIFGTTGVCRFYFNGTHRIVICCPQSILRWVEEERWCTRRETIRSRECVITYICVAKPIRQDSDRADHTTMWPALIVVSSTTTSTRSPGNSTRLSTLVSNTRNVNLYYCYSCCLAIFWIYNGQYF